MSGVPKQIPKIAARSRAMVAGKGAPKRNGGARLTRVVYADRAVGGIELAGDHERVSRAAYRAGNPHLDQEV